MPRIRTIKPELPSDLKLSRVSRDARLTFVYLITQADDFGLVPGSPRQLLGLLYPHEDDVSPADLLRWVAELQRAGQVRRRQTKDGAPVLEIANWERHQRVDNRGRSSLAESLVPFAENGGEYVEHVAEVRGEPPRDAEDGGDSRLGPRTLDLGSGPRTGDLLPGDENSPGPEKPARSDRKAKREAPPLRPLAAGWSANWVEDLHQFIREQCRALIDHGRLGRAFRTAVRTYPRELVTAALVEYDCHRVARKVAFDPAHAAADLPAAIALLDLPDDHPKRTRYRDGRDAA